MLFGSFAAVALALFATPSPVAGRIEADVHHLRAFTLDLPFIDEGFQMRHYDFNGDAIVNTLSHIRLTADQPSRMGSIWSTLPLPDDYWKVDFKFKVGGKGGYLYGDGMGMFVTKERAQSGPVFGNRDYFNGLGVLFDTYPNGKHDFSTPFVMGMIGDGKTPYDGAHDGDANRRGMCEAHFRNLKEGSRCSVTYMKGVAVSVQLKLQPKEKWMNCFVIPNVTLPENSYLGFTALTGDISDNHDILSVRAETLRSDALKDFNFHMDSLLNSNTPSPHSSTIGFVLKLLLVVGACGGLFVAYKKYSAESARRF
ncbi:hypothetical protein H4R24_003065 [Coemansia sp. RSA 988]|nr:hypothetical protein H4R24_003065 [Coemansia sp. RSA 988]